MKVMTDTQVIEALDEKGVKNAIDLAITYAVAKARPKVERKTKKRRTFWDLLRSKRRLQSTLKSSSEKK